MAIRDIIGKAVTVTGNCEAGYGAEGKPVLGVAVQVEKAVNTSVYPLGFNGVQHGATFKLDTATKTTLDDKAQDDYVVTVGFNQAFEDVPITEDAAKQPSAGDILAVDGKGGVMKATEGGNAVAISVDTASALATIRV